MAEGHAVRRWVRTLHPLVGEPLLHVQLTRRWADRVGALVGGHLTAVEARGKHMLLHLSTGGAIHCHAMQYGSWQVGEPGMERRKEDKWVRVWLLTPNHEAVFYHGPVVELLTAEELATHPALLSLGPDVLDEPFDRAAAFARVQAQGARPIGDTVLDQRVMAGIGNIFKSEGLFLAGIDPRRPAQEVSRAAMDRYWDTTIPLMRAGIETWGPTKTLPAALQGPTSRSWHWVYNRNGQACWRCGSKISRIRQGELQRATFFCPTCQVENAAPDRVESA